MLNNRSRALRRISLSVVLFGTLFAQENAMARNGAPSPSHSTATATATAAVATSTSTGSSPNQPVLVTESVVAQTGYNDRDPRRYRIHKVLQPVYACGENDPICQQNALDAH